MAKPDFSKVFAQNGPVSPLTDDQLLQGFGYLGDNPPTVEDFNWLFRELYLKAQWLDRAISDIGNYWKPIKAYAVGDVVYSLALGASYKRMECVVPGTSGAMEPAWPAVGLFVADGTVKWRVVDVKSSGGSMGRNLVLTGPLSTQGVAQLLQAQSGNSLIVQAGGVISFADGIATTGPVDHIHAIPSDITLPSLPAADGNTIPLAYTDDLCYGGTAIASGTGAGGYTPAGAFDNINSVTPTNSWNSPSPAINHWIGYDFGVARAIRKIFIHQGGLGVTGGQGVYSLKVQYSSDGTTWQTSVAVANLVGYANYITVPAVGAYRYWRLAALTNAYTAGIGWAINEIEMYEALQTYYIHATRAVDGSVTYGYTRNKPRVGRFNAVTDVYTDNLCVGGAAISGGDWTEVSMPKERAFDGSKATAWGSAQLGDAVVNTSYIGYDFGVARHIRRITFSSPDAHVVNTVKVQRSTDGTTWIDVATLNNVGSAGSFLLPSSTPSRYWRALAASSPVTPGWGWHIIELIMHELATELDHYDPYDGRSRYYDSTIWTPLVRKFIGEVTVDSTGKIVNLTSYPYGLGKLMTLPAEGPDDVVTLGQFGCNLAPNGWQYLPGGLIMQWGLNSIASPVGYVTFPITFPNACTIVQLTDLSATNQQFQSAESGYVTTSNFMVRTNLPAGGFDGFYWFAIGY